MNYSQSQYQNVKPSGYELGILNRLGNIMKKPRMN